VTALLRLETRLVAVVKGLLGLVLIAMVVLNVANAAGRYGGLPTLTGADEAMVYGMIWVVMLGAILAARARDHLVIDLLPGALPPRGRAALQLLTDAATLAVCAFVAWQSWAFIERIGLLNQVSMGLGIPMTWAHGAILTGFAGMAAVAAGLVAADLARLAGGRG
jgi:TRAP-type C4-dicarboxylate transport system permease small subunit